MPGGDTRHSIALSPYPIYSRSGKGCRITDVEGDERVDFLNNYTSLILGHADPEVLQAVHRRIDLGTAYTMPTEEEVALAELLVERVAYIDQVRFCNSGTEAVMLAVKAARAYTGRPKIAKFEGAYHGGYDYVQVSEGATADNWGEPAAPASVIEPSSAPSVAGDVVILPWNNLEACRNLIHQHKAQLAAVLFDVNPSGIGMIPPQADFLEGLCEAARSGGALLISDEVMSFRISNHGALDGRGISPDLTALGKIIGGGFPIGAVGGSRRLMSVFDLTASAKVHHGGTYNGNPVTMTAGLATMRQMTRAAFDRLNELGGYLRDRLLRMFHDRGIPGQVCGAGSLFIAHLTADPLVDFRSLSGFSRTNPAYSGLAHEMFANGFICSPRGLFGCLSTPMTRAELDGFVEAVERSLLALNSPAR